MATKTDAEIEAIYKGAHSHSHTAALRAVYQAGAADAGAARAESTDARAQVPLEPKRPIKNPGDAPAATTDGGAPTPPTAKANIPNTPAPGTDPPGGEHPPANAG